MTPAVDNTFLLRTRDARPLYKTGDAYNFSIFKLAAWFPKCPLGPPLLKAETSVFLSWMIVMFPNELLLRRQRCSIKDKGNRFKSFKESEQEEKSHSFLGSNDNEVTLIRYQLHKIISWIIKRKITLTKEFCAQPLSLVWLLYIQKAEFKEDNWVKRH